MDFDSLKDSGSGLGTAGVIVINKQTNIVKFIARLSEFYKHESCGQCTPCRNGTSMAVKLMEQKDWDIEVLNKLSITMNKASICGLGQAAPNPLQCIIKYFEEDLK